MSNYGNLAKDAGRIVANPFADPKRVHKAQHEDYYNALSGSDQIDAVDAVTETGNWTGIKIEMPDGTTETLTFFAVAVTDEQDVIDAIAAELAAKGEINQVIEYSHGAFATNGVVFRHVGLIKVTDLVNSGGSGGDVSTTRYSTVTTQTRQTGFFVDAEVVTVDGAAFAGASAPYAWTGTPATDATTAGNFADDLVTALDALGVSYNGVTVRVDDVAEKYEVNIFTHSGDLVKINGATLNVVGRKEIFV